MSIQEQCGLKAQEITKNIMEQNGSNAFQINEASENAYKSAIASYDATLAANKGVTTNEVEATKTAFTSSVTASSVASVTSTLIQNTIVSNTTLYLAQKFSFEKPILDTYNYYWDLYPDLFGRIQIVYTDIDENGNQIIDNKIIIQNNIKYLNEYYSKGYKLFIGFCISTILKGVLPWFETIGIEAKGISMTSSAISLNFPKSVYRLAISDNKIVDSLNSILTNASKIYYVYSENQIASQDTLLYLESLYPGKIILYSVKFNSSNLTLVNIQNLYKDVDANSITIMNMFIDTQQSDFVNLFNDSYPMPNSTFDICQNNPPKINESSKNALINKYTFLSNVSFSTSKLFRDGLDSLKELFSTYVPNALLLINKLAVNGNIKTLPAHNSILEFDENNDIKYFTFLNSIYSKDDKGEYYYKQYFYSVYDPIVGKQIFYVNN